MRTFTEVTTALRRKNISQYGLLMGCCFFSVLLITAFVTMMRSPTILMVLPEGGDSRKQVMMIFILAVIGCGVFTTYASSLFFRYKSREVGIFLALGASKHSLSRVLSLELLLMALVSCVLGTVLGMPLAWVLWQGFRLLIVDSKEMAFLFDPQAMLFALVFSLFVFLMLFVMQIRFLKRTNILDVVNEGHKSESVRLVPRYFGWVGILLILAGCLLGYQMPGILIHGLHWYPPDLLTSIFYIPALLGLYMVLLHTVVNGWRRGKNRYHGIISTSMMRFQGRQTVRNMIVISLLVTGGFFAAFYTPLVTTSSAYGYDTRQMDYFFHYRSDQNIPKESEIRAMAEEMDVAITWYATIPSAVLGIDGIRQVERDASVGTTYEEVYYQLMCSSTFLSESNYNALTNRNVSLEPGELLTVYSDDGQSDGMTDNNIKYITNAITNEVLPVVSREEVEKNTLLFGYRIMNDDDYAHMTEGLPKEWREDIIAFDVEQVKETYAFSQALFHEIVGRSGPEVEVDGSWDAVEKLLAVQKGEPYIYDNDQLPLIGYAPLNYDNMDSSQFRLGWKYMPQFRILDQNDLIRTMAVFLILFIFVSILCMAAVMVILFTRSMTIAMTNRKVYKDLGKLGASKSYLHGTVRNQISRIFLAPILTGTLLIGIFYSMILYFNDGRFSAAEQRSVVNCLLIVAGVMVLFYGLYRLTLTHVCRALGLYKTK